jgi:hypothetical protein
VLWPFLAIGNVLDGFPLVWVTTQCWTVMASIFPVLFALIITVALMTAAALFTPKGPNQV